MDDSVTFLGENVFSGCSKLTNVRLSNSISKINGGTFEDCTSLKRLTLPSSLPSIEYGAFYNCTNLTQITIPDTVTYIVAAGFSDSNDELTIYGNRNSYSQRYAEDIDIKFKPIAPYRNSTEMKVGSTAGLKLNSGSSCIWKSCNPIIATVDQNGIVTALKEGTVFITGTLYGKSYTFKVVVK